MLEGFPINPRQFRIYDPITMNVTTNRFIKIEWSQKGLRGILTKTARRVRFNRFYVS